MGKRVTLGGKRVTLGGKRVTLGRKRLTLGPESRLRRSAEIARCRNEGTKLYSKHFLVIAAPGSSPESRVAVAVTTKIEKRATVRNRIKRRIKDLFRKHRHELTEVLDLLIVARRDVQQCDFDDYQREILGALRSRGYLTKKTSQNLACASFCLLATAIGTLAC